MVAFSAGRWDWWGLAQALYSGEGAAGGALALRALKQGAPWDSWAPENRKQVRNWACPHEVI